MTATFSEASPALRWAISPWVTGRPPTSSAAPRSTPSMSPLPARRGDRRRGRRCGPGNGRQNGNTAATQFSITCINAPDTMAPTVTLTSTATSPTNTSPIPMTATFSERLPALRPEDITVGNGAAATSSAAAPSIPSTSPLPDGAVTVDIAAEVAHDAAGNINTAATQFSITYDSVAPTVTLTSTATSPTKTSPIPMTATFSEASPAS